MCTSQKVKGAIMQNLSCNIFNLEAVVRWCSVENVILGVRYTYSFTPGWISALG